MQLEIIMEVRTYIGIAEADTGNAQNYPVGERHAFNLFVSQGIGDDPKWDVAEGIVEGNAWLNVEIKKTGILSASLIEKAEAPFHEMYEAALKDGSAFLIYSNPEPVYSSA